MQGRRTPPLACHGSIPLKRGREAYWGWISSKQEELDQAMLPGSMRPGLAHPSPDGARLGWATPSLAQVQCTWGRCVPCCSKAGQGRCIPPLSEARQVCPLLQQGQAGVVKESLGEYRNLPCWARLRWVPTSLCLQLAAVDCFYPSVWVRVAPPDLFQVALIANLSQVTMQLQSCSMPVQGR